MHVHGYTRRVFAQPPFAAKPSHANTHSLLTINTAFVGTCIVKNHLDKLTEIVS